MRGEGVKEKAGRAPKSEGPGRRCPDEKREEEERGHAPKSEGPGWRCEVKV